MPISLFAFLGFYLAVSLIVMVLASMLYRRYRYRFLFYFILFLAGSYLHGFMDILGSHFTQGLVRSVEAGSASLQLLGHTFHLLAMPFFAASFYCLIRMIVEILSGRFQHRYTTIFWTAEIALMGVFLYLLVTFSTGDGFSRSFSLVMFQYSVAAIHYVLAVVLLIIMMFRLSAQGGNGLAVRLRTFGGLYAIMFMARAGLLLFYRYAGVICYGQPMLIFLMHIPPLIYLWTTMNRHAEVPDYDRIDPDRVLDLFRQYGISEREQEVARLIGAGKSNREIEEVLCISIKTVKTHTYNIYRKMGINSRYQLMQLLQQRSLKENAAGE